MARSKAVFGDSSTARERTLQPRSGAFLTRHPLKKVKECPLSFLALPLPTCEPEGALFYVHATVDCRRRHLWCLLCGKYGGCSGSPTSGKWDSLIARSRPNSSGSISGMTRPVEKSSPAARNQSVTYRQLFSAERSKIARLKTQHRVRPPQSSGLCLFRLASRVEDVFPIFAHARQKLLAKKTCFRYTY